MGRRAAQPVPPARDTSRWAGGVLTFAGLVCWALSLTVFEPAVHAGADLIRTSTWTSEHKRPPADEVVALMLWAKDLRWAGIVLAVGGLLIVLAARAALLLIVPLWLGLDIYVDRADIGGREAFAALTFTVGVVLAAIVWAARHLRAPTGSRAALIYCGIASPMAPMMVYADPFTAPFRPKGMAVVAVAVAWAWPWRLCWWH